MKNKLYTAEEAVQTFVKPGTRFTYPGFDNSGFPFEILSTIREDFLEKGYPRDIKVMVGGGNEQANIFGLEGLMCEYTAGHYGHLGVDVRKLVSEEKMTSYNYPQGVIGHLLRARANGKSGLLTKIGLGTYMDPRVEGGKMNKCTTEDRIHLVTIDGDEYLYYDCPNIDLAILRATAVDELGNVSFKDDVYKSFSVYAAMAAKACGGKVLVECRDYVKAGSMDARDVDIPGTMVDGIVIMQNPAVSAGHSHTIVYDPTFLGIYKPVGSSMESKGLNAKMLIGRRAAMELPPNATINMGIGVPENVSATASMEGCIDDIVLTVEGGVIGGEAYEGKFGLSVNQDCMYDEPTQFDFFHAGMLDIAFLGMAEANGQGDVNSSKFNNMVNGCGGFIDIVQSAPKTVFCSTFTAGGLREHIEDGKLFIDVEGRNHKFVDQVQQVTFSAKQALKDGREILYVTERAVFKLTNDGLLLTEIAPGIDLEKDILGQMGFKPIIPDDVKLMDSKLFYNEPFGLKEIIESKKVG